MARTLRVRRRTSTVSVTGRRGSRMLPAVPSTCIIRHARTRPAPRRAARRPPGAAGPYQPVNRAASRVPVRSLRARPVPGDPFGEFGPRCARSGHPLLGSDPSMSADRSRHVPPLSSGFVGTTRVWALRKLSAGYVAPVSNFAVGGCVWAPFRRVPFSALVHRRDASLSRPRVRRPGRTCTARK